MKNSILRMSLTTIVLGLLVTGMLGAATVLTTADGVIRNSLCVGFDCPNSPSFSDSTIILVENNTRIKFADTSNSASFPQNDWEIEANSNLNGGANYLGFNDCGTGSNAGGCADDLVFAVEAGARQHALYVEADGDVGFGTNNPVVNLHVIDGNTPTLRLEQDGSSGFTPQTWDLAGNETNFFIRDVTGGSKLPFRIRPGAPTSSIDIATNGNVGIGTTSPAAPLHISRTTGQGELTITSNGTGTNFSRFNLQNLGTGTAAGTWEVTNTGNFVINQQFDAVEFELSPSGALTILGPITTGGGTCGGGCDFVFDPAYELESIEEHAEYMWSKSHLKGVGPTKENAAINLSEKVGGILNELEKAHIYIDRLNERLVTQQIELEKLTLRLAQMESGKTASAQQN